MMPSMRRREKSNKTTSSKEYLKSMANSANISQAGDKGCIRYLRMEMSELIKESKRIQLIDMYYDI